MLLFGVDNIIWISAEGPGVAKFMFFLLLLFPSFILRLVLLCLVFLLPFLYVSPLSKKNKK